MTFLKLVLYIKQPAICRWNLEKFAKAMQMALPVDLSKEELGLHDEEFDKCYMCQMRNKLGLLREELPEDK